MPTLHLIDLLGFSFGLSYTTFSYSSLKVGSPRGSPPTVYITFTVTNTGSVTGSEAAQLYITLPPNGLTTPKLQLRAFAKVRDLKPGAKRDVTVQLTKYALSFWDVTITGEKSKERGAWRAKEGIYSVAVGGSSNNLPLQGEFELKHGFVWEGL